MDKNRKYSICRGEFGEGLMVGYLDIPASWVDKVVLAKARKKIKSYCCKNCGYLESYAE